MGKLKCSKCGVVKKSDFAFDICSCGETLEGKKMKTIKVDSPKELLKLMGEK